MCHVTNVLPGSKMEVVSAAARVFLLFWLVLMFPDVTFLDTEPGKHHGIQSLDSCALLRFLSLVSWTIPWPVDYL